VFDLVACLHSPSILGRTMHDPATGRRCALPPWDYAHHLAQLAVARPGAGRHGWRDNSAELEIAKILTEALTTRDPEDAVSIALKVISPLEYIARRYGRWAREPVYASVEPVPVREGALEETRATVEVHDYTPDYEAWGFELLEHVLALGPKGKGWTSETRVAVRAAKLAERVA
jgi:hypothetical protein